MEMEKLRSCPFRVNDFFDCRCRIEIFRTAEPAPKNIRMVCKTHTFTLPGIYATVEEAEEAWNRRVKDDTARD